jgi:hypothetical protein
MKVNLTSGEVDLSLINDFRAVANINIPVQSAAGGDVEIPIFTEKGVANMTVNNADYYDYTSDQLITYTVTANATGLPRQFNFERNDEPYLTIYQDA